MQVPESMREFITYHRRMFTLMAVICAAVLAVLLLAMPGELAWAGGFAAGAAAQLFKFGVLDIAAIKKIATEQKDAATAQVKSMYLSLLVFALAVAAVYKLGLNVWAMAAGIFLPRLILVADTYIRPNPFKRPDGESALPEVEDKGV